MSEIPFLKHCDRVEDFLLSKYGIAVVTRDIPDPLTGDLDGLEIHVDYSLTAEERLFLLAHLFGHTVQWNVNPAAFEIGRQYRPPIEEDLFPARKGKKRGDSPSRPMSEQKVKEFCLYDLTMGSRSKSAGIHVGLSTTYIYEGYLPFQLAADQASVSGCSDRIEE